MYNGLCLAVGYAFSIMPLLSLCVVHYYFILFYFISFIHSLKPPTCGENMHTYMYRGITVTSQSQQTQNICVTFVQRRSNTVQILYKCLLRCPIATMTNKQLAYILQQWWIK